MQLSSTRVSFNGTLRIDKNLTDSIKNDIKSSDNPKGYNEQLLQSLKVAESMIKEATPPSTTIILTSPDGISSELTANVADSATDIKNKPIKGFKSDLNELFNDPSKVIGSLLLKFVGINYQAQETKVLNSIFDKMEENTHSKLEITPQFKQTLLFMLNKSEDTNQFMNKFRKAAVEVVKSVNKNLKPNTQIKLAFGYNLKYGVTMRIKYTDPEKNLKNHQLQEFEQPIANFLNNPKETMEDLMATISLFVGNSNEDSELQSILSQYS